MARDLLATMGNAFGFIASKEVVVAPWFKKPDVELLDPSGELLTIYLDVTLPALHQEAIVSREKVYDNARKEKAAAYPRKDSSGRLINESFCVPFILTSMGGLCKEGHDFILLCRKRNKSGTARLLDILVTQHAKWTARRIRRALFGQSLVDFSGSSWSCVKIRESPKEPPIMNRRKKQTSRLMAEFSQHADTESDAASAPNFPGGLCAAKEAMKPQVADSDSVASGPEEPMKDVFTASS